MKTRVVEIGFFQTERSSPPSARTPSAARSRAATPNAHAMADPSPAKKARLSLGGVDTVVVLDYGSQYTQLITRRVRELGVYAVLLPGDVDMVRPRARGGASSAGRRSPDPRSSSSPSSSSSRLPTRADPSSVADLSYGQTPSPPADARDRSTDPIDPIERFFKSFLCSLALAEIESPPPPLTILPPSLLAPHRNASRT